MDDKTYPYIVLTKEENPRILYTRDIKKNSEEKINMFLVPIQMQRLVRTLLRF